MKEKLVPGLAARSFPFSSIHQSALPERNDPGSAAVDTIALGCDPSRLPRQTLIAREVGPAGGPTREELEGHDGGPMRLRDDDVGDAVEGVDISIGATGSMDPMGTQIGMSVKFGDDHGIRLHRRGRQVDCGLSSRGLPLHAQTPRDDIEVDPTSFLVLAVVGMNRSVRSLPRLPERPCHGMVRSQFIKIGDLPTQEFDTLGEIVPGKRVFQDG